MPDREFMLEVLKLSVIGAAGGAAKYLQSYLESAKFHLGYFFATIGIGAFSGWLVGWIVSALSPTWAYAGAGAGGIVGLQLVYLIVAVVAKATGRAYGINVDPDALLKTKQRPRP